MDTAPNNSTIETKNAAKSGASFDDSRYNEDKPIVSIEEYRKLLKDYTTPDARVVERINYIASFSRKIIKMELKKYVGRK